MNTANFNVVLASYSDIVAEADVPNKNNHSYPRHVLQSMVDQSKDRQILGTIGTIGMIGAFDLTPDIAALKVTNLELNDKGHLVGEFVIFNNEQGNLLTKLLEDANPKLDFRVAGMGSVKPKDGSFIIQDDFQLVSINAVYDGA